MWYELCYVDVTWGVHVTSRMCGVSCEMRRVGRDVQSVERARCGVWGVTCELRSVGCARCSMCITCPVHAGSKSRHSAHTSARNASGSSPARRFRFSGSGVIF